MSTKTWLSVQEVNSYDAVMKECRGRERFAREDLVVCPKAG